MRRFLLVASVIGVLTVVGADAAQAGTPVQVVGWDHHHHAVVDRYCYPPVRYVPPEVVYYPPVVTTAPVVAAPVVAPAPVVATPPAGFISIGGRHFGIQLGF